MTKRVKLLGSLIVAFLLCLCIGIVPLFTSAPNKASAAAYGLRYDSSQADAQKLNTYYTNHWKVGQGQRVSGEDYGKWYFGYGDVSTSAYTFTQATYASKGDADNNSQYTTGFAHQMHYQFDVSTRKYSEASTQTMFVWESETAGYVSFSGIAAKNSDANMESLAGTQNGFDPIWMPGINTGANQFDWTSGDSYTISIWLVSGTSGKLIMEKTFTAGFAFAFPTDQIKVGATDKIVFGYKCNALGTGHDEWGTNAVWLLSSQFTAKDLSGYKNYEFVGQSSGLTTSYINHWSSNGAKASGETNGTWKFGTGSVSSSAYSFSQAAQNTTVTADTKKWGTGANMMSWGFSVGTSTTTASIYEMTADKAGSFKFSGIISKSTFDKENLAGAQNNCNSIWLNGINHVSGDFNWYNGDSYKVGMYKVSTSGAVTVLYEKNYTSQYAWLVPQDPINLLAGEKVVFSLQANSFGAIGGTDKSSTMMLLTSQATDKIIASVTNDNAKGSVTGITAGQELTAGASVSIAITPSAGYRISSVTWNGSAQTVTASGMTLTKTIDANGANLVVTYAAIPTYTVSITNDNTKGTLNTDIVSGSSYEEGKAIQVSIASNTGYKITSVKWNGTEKLSTAATSYTLNETLTANSTLVITYEQTAITATVNYDGDMGTVTGIQNGASYNLGANLAITITPDAGYEITAITFNGVSEQVNATGTTLSKTVTDAGLVLNVTFSPKVYTVTLTNGLQGTVTGIASGSYEGGTTLNVSITANSGYVVSNVTWNGSTPSGFVAGQNSANFSVQVFEDSTLIVQYQAEGSGGGGTTPDPEPGDTPDAEVTYKASVTINDKKMGTSSIRDNAEYEENAEVKLKVTAKDGYEIVSIKINGKAQKITDATKFEKEITFSDDVEIEIEFGEASATEMVKGWACLSSLNSVAPVGLVLVLGAVAMLFIKKQRNN